MCNVDECYFLHSQWNNVIEINMQISEHACDGKRHQLLEGCGVLCVLIHAGPIVDQLLTSSWPIMDSRQLHISQTFCQSQRIFRTASRSEAFCTRFTNSRHLMRPTLQRSLLKSSCTYTVDSSFVSSLQQALNLYTATFVILFSTNWILSSIIVVILNALLFCRSST